MTTAQANTNPSFQGRSFQPLPVGSKVLVVTSPALIHLLLQDHFTENLEGLTYVNEAIVGLMDSVQANPVHGILTGTVDDVGVTTGLGLHQVNVCFDEPAVSLFDTETPITKVIKDLPTGTFKPMVGMSGDDLLLAALTPIAGMDPEEFERSHPWFNRIGLSAQRRSEILFQLGDLNLLSAAEELDDEALELVEKEQPGFRAQRDLVLSPDGNEESEAFVIDFMRKYSTMKRTERLYLVFPHSEDTSFLQRIFQRFVTELEKTGETSKDAHALTLQRS